MAFPSDKNVTRDVDGFIGVPTPAKSQHAVPLGYLDERFAPLDTKRPLPSGSDLDTLLVSGMWSIETPALANTMVNLPVPPIPATAPNLALNEKCVSTQPVGAITNNATYWTVTRAVAAGTSALGTTTWDQIKPTGTPVGNGQIASVFNVDGLGNTAATRTISMEVYFNGIAPVEREYRVQAAGSWLPLTNHQRVSWDAPANTHAVLEVRRPTGVAYTTDAVWITDITSTPGPGTIRNGSMGLLRVSATVNRVMQEFYFPLSFGTALTLRWAYYRRIRNSQQIWGPWILQDPTSSVYNDPEQQAAAAQLNPNRNSPVWVQRMDARGVGIYGTTNGNTWWQSTGNGVSAPGWNSLSLQNGWANYGSIYLGGQYKRTQAGIVMLRGLVGGGVQNTVITTLPVGYRPAQQMLFQTLTGSGYGQVTISPNGQVILGGNSYGAGTVGFTSFADIKFPCAEVAPNSKWIRLAPRNGFYDWTDQGGTSWPPLSYWVDEIGRYWVRGLSGRASTPGAQDYISLPAAAATSKQIHLPACSNTGFSSQHYGASSGTDTNFYWKPSGGHGYTWFSVPSAPIIPSAIAPESQWTNHGLLNGWASYDTNSFPPASTWEAPDGITHMRGLVRSGTGVIFNIGATYGATPLGQSIHIVNATEQPGRADMASTNLTYNFGTTSWFSLDNITYLRES